MGAFYEAAFVFLLSSISGWAGWVLGHSRATDKADQRWRGVVSELTRAHKDEIRRVYGEKEC